MTGARDLPASKCSATFRARCKQGSTRERWFMKGLERTFLFLFSILVLTMSACSNPLDSSSTDGVDFIPQALGMDYCYDCHNVPGSGQKFEQIFREWVVSRHSNFDYYDTSTGNHLQLDPFNLGSYFYSDVTGYPSFYSNPGLYPAACSPCHMGPDDGGQILDANAGGTIFSTPNLGEQYRFIIDCEACHVSGTGHFGGASPPEVPIPAFHQCTECHPPTEPMLALPAFADAMPYPNIIPGVGDRTRARTPAERSSRHCSGRPRIARSRIADRSRAKPQSKHQAGSGSAR